MENTQLKDLLKLIKKQPNCTIQTQYLQNIEQVVANIVKTILDEKFTNSIDMEAVLCLISTFLEYSKSSNSTKKPYVLNNKFTDWMTNMKIIDSSSLYGTAFISTIINENIKVVLKVSKQGKNRNNYIIKQDEIQLYREYVLGVNAINKLRYYIPTLAYVLGIFKCFHPNINGNISSNLCNPLRKGVTTPYVIYEYISGPSISSIINKFNPNDGNDNENFKKFLEIFVQILITLEIGQRECNFTHFDLHSSNIMSKIYSSSNPFKYDVSFDDYTYQITTTTVPVIIDYGVTCAKINNKIYGSEKRGGGIMKNMIPGFDMYRFLASILNCLHKKTNRNWKLKTYIQRLFSFYQNDDFYNVMVDGPNKAAREYSSKVSTTKLATYTPKMFLDWILDESKDYSILLTNIIKVKPRKVYMPIHASILTNEYNKIFNNFANGKIEAVNIIKNCCKLSPSYLMNKYNIYVLTKYTKKTDFNDPQILTSIRYIKNIIENPQWKQLMINFDMTILSNYIKIIPPTYNYVEETVNLIPLLRDNNLHNIYSSKVKKLFLFKKQIELYLDYVYIIREIKLKNTNPYSIWINRFENESVYVFYKNYITHINRCIRWNEVLKTIK